jgi:D-amino-acid dehydrogenase
MPKDIVIIGGGIIGLCCAWYAQRAGHRVRVVERGAPDHDSCSLGNAGLIVPSHFVPLAAPGMVGMGLRMMRNPESPFYIRPRLNGDLMRWGLGFLRAANAEHVARSAPLLRDLLLQSRRYYEELAEERGNDFGLTQKGLLMLCKSEATLQEEAHVAEMAKKLGLAAEVLTPEETAKLDPGVRMDIAGAVYFPQDCHLTPQKLVAGLTCDLQANGVEFLWSTEAEGWRTQSGHIDAIRTNRGELEAEEFVLAGGSWSAQLTKGLGLRMPLQAGKGYSLTLPRPRQLPTISSLLIEARVAVTPMGETLRFGGTMEVNGFDTSVNPARVNGLLKSIPNYFPDFSPDDFRDVPVWSGLRPCSPDGLPYLGRTSRYANLTVAAGHAMLGVSLGPITGQIVTDILSNKTPRMNIELLNPERYGGSHFSPGKLIGNWS